MPSLPEQESNICSPFRSRYCISKFDVSAMKCDLHGQQSSGLHHGHAIEHCRHNVADESISTYHIYHIYHISTYHIYLPSHAVVAEPSSESWLFLSEPLGLAATLEDLEMGRCLQAASVSEKICLLLLAAALV
jgi:hypothetical protein